MDLQFKNWSFVLALISLLTIIINAHPITNLARIISSSSQSENCKYLPNAKTGKFSNRFDFFTERDCDARTIKSAFEKIKQADGAFVEDYLSLFPCAKINDLPINSSRATEGTGKTSATIKNGRSIFTTAVNMMSTTTLPEVFVPLNESFSIIKMTRLVNGEKMGGMLWPGDRISIWGRVHPNASNFKIHFCAGVDYCDDKLLDDDSKTGDIPLLIEFWFSKAENEDYDFKMVISAYIRSRNQKEHWKRWIERPEQKVEKNPLLQMKENETPLDFILHIDILTTGFNISIEAFEKDSGVKRQLAANNTFFDTPENKMNIEIEKRLPTWLPDHLHITGNITLTKNIQREFIDNDPLGAPYISKIKRELANGSVIRIIGDALFEKMKTEENEKSVFSIGLYQNATGYHKRYGKSFLKIIYESNDEIYLICGGCKNAEKKSIFDDEQKNCANCHSRHFVILIQFFTTKDVETSFEFQIIFLNFGWQQKFVSKLPFSSAELLLIDGNFTLNEDVRIEYDKKWSQINSSTSLRNLARLNGDKMGGLLVPGDRISIQGIMDEGVELFIVHLCSAGTVVCDEKSMNHGEVGDMTLYIKFIFTKKEEEKEYGGDKIVISAYIRSRGEPDDRWISEREQILKDNPLKALKKKGTLAFLLNIDILSTGFNISMGTINEPAIKAFHFKTTADKYELDQRLPTWSADYLHILGDVTINKIKREFTDNGLTAPYVHKITRPLQIPSSIRIKGEAQYEMVKEGGNLLTVFSIGFYQNAVGYHKGNGIVPLQIDYRFDETFLIYNKDCEDDSSDQCFQEPELKEDLFSKDDGKTEKCPLCRIRNFDINIHLVDSLITEYDREFNFNITFNNVWSTLFASKLSPWSSDLFFINGTFKLQNEPIFNYDEEWHRRDMSISFNNLTRVNGNKKGGILWPGDRISIWGKVDLNAGSFIVHLCVGTTKCDEVYMDSDNKDSGDMNLFLDFLFKKKPKYKENDLVLSEYIRELGKGDRWLKNTEGMFTVINPLFDWTKKGNLNFVLHIDTLPNGFNISAEGVKEDAITNVQLMNEPIFINKSEEIRLRNSGTKRLPTWSAEHLHITGDVEINKIERKYVESQDKLATPYVRQLNRPLTKGSNVWISGSSEFVINENEDVKKIFAIGFYRDALGYYPKLRTGKVCLRMEYTDDQMFMIWQGTCNGECDRDQLRIALVENKDSPGTCANCQKRKFDFHIQLLEKQQNDNADVNFNFNVSINKRWNKIIPSILPLGECDLFFIDGKFQLEQHVLFK